MVNVLQVSQSHFTYVKCSRPTFKNADVELECLGVSLLRTSCLVDPSAVESRLIMAYVGHTYYGYISQDRLQPKLAYFEFQWHKLHDRLLKEYKTVSDVNVLDFFRKKVDPNT